MADSRTVQEKRRDKIMGDLAESIFEQMHQRDLRCIVRQSGHERIFPDMLNLANMKKKVEAVKLKERGLKVPKNWYKPTKLGTKIAKNPDFTVITSDGGFVQFEVKYRHDGLLSDKEKDSILANHPDACIFIIMDKPPFVNILVPAICALEVWGDMGSWEFKELRALYRLLFDKYPKLDSKFEALPEVKHVETITTVKDGKKITINVVDYPRNDFLIQQMIEPLSKSRRRFIDARDSYFETFWNCPPAGEEEDLIVYTESGNLSYPVGVFAKYGKIIAKTLANLN